jgi:hypothetical protein
MKYSKLIAPDHGSRKNMVAIESDSIVRSFLNSSRKSNDDKENNWSG